MVARGAIEAMACIAQLNRRARDAVREEHAALIARLHVDQRHMVGNSPVGTLFEMACSLWSRCYSCGARTRAGREFAMIGSATEAVVNVGICTKCYNSRAAAAGCDPFDVKSPLSQTSRYRAVRAAGVMLVPPFTLVLASLDRLLPRKSATIFVLESTNAVEEEHKRCDQARERVQIEHTLRPRGERAVRACPMYRGPCCNREGCEPL